MPILIKKSMYGQNEFIIIVLVSAGPMSKYQFGVRSVYVPLNGSQLRNVLAVFAPVSKIRRPVFRKVEMKIAKKTAEVYSDSVW